MARAYAMSARAEATQRTRESILDATIALAYELQRVDLSLEQIAARAGRSVQTMLRHFGTRDALIAAAIERGAAEVIRERTAPPGDRARALELLVDHYELRGRFVLRLLAATEGDAGQVTANGRLLHRAWVQEVYADDIAGAADPDELTDLLVVATDVYSWKLLRLDRGLAATVVRERIAAMARAVIAQARPQAPAQSPEKEDTS
ncbi:MAG: TetR/AcrR family transcriptional regulator [Schumannella sp.]|nr:TetR/AcrR family transcriptional regulator [Microbacteriaceae bacterium]